MLLTGPKQKAPSGFSQWTTTLLPLRVSFADRQPSSLLHPSPVLWVNIHSAERSATCRDFLVSNVSAYYLCASYNYPYLFFITVLSVSGASLVAQLVKTPPAMQETPVWFLGSEAPLEKGRAATAVVLGFPGGSDGNESACDVGDLGSVPIRLLLICRVEVRVSNNVLTESKELLKEKACCSCIFLSFSVLSIITLFFQCVWFKHSRLKPYTLLDS